MKVSIGVAALLCTCVVWSVRAEERSETAPPQMVQSLLGRNRTLEQVLAGLRPSLARLDADQDGKLDAADVALQASLSRADATAHQMSETFRFDLDADGAVTEAEIRARLRIMYRDGAAASAAATEREEWELKQQLALDQNADGKITPDEVIAATRSKPRPQMGQAEDIPKLAAAFGLRADQSVPVTAYLDAAASMFDAVDTDHDRIISDDELSAARRRWRQLEDAAAAARRQQQEDEAFAAACSAPKPSDDASVVLLSAYEGAALSSTTIGSQDATVRVGDITVEPGGEPLYLVVASYRGMVWRVNGAVERIERVLLTAMARLDEGGGPDAVRSTAPLAGLVGIPAAKVSFLKPEACVKPFWEQPSTNAAIAAAAVRKATGKEPKSAARYQVVGFSVPSGAVQTIDRAGAPRVVIQKPSGSLTIQGGANVVVETGASSVAADVARFYPGGIIDVDPASVVAPAPAARYEILPDSAGLLQLIQRGAVEQTPQGEFLIKKQIRVPAGGFPTLSRFLLLRGVPDPEGRLGGACIIREDTGKPVGGRNQCS